MEQLQNLPINATDVVVIIVLLLSGLLALLRGFVAEILSIASWVGALAVAVYNYIHLKPYILELIAISDTLADIASGAILFVVAVVVFSLFSRFVSGAMEGAGLGAVDRSLGFVFGLARGAVFVCLAYLAFLAAVPKQEEHPGWLTEAKTLPYIQKGADLLKVLVPEHMKDDAFIAAERKKKQSEERLLQQIQDGLLSPTPKSDASEDRTGYTAKERQGMQRAIQGTQ